MSDNEFDFFDLENILEMNITSRGGEVEKIVKEETPVAPAPKAEAPVVKKEAPAPKAETPKKVSPAKEAPNKPVASDKKPETPVKKVEAPKKPAQRVQAKRPVEPAPVSKTSTPAPAKKAEPVVPVASSDSRTNKSRFCTIYNTAYENALKAYKGDSQFSYSKDATLREYFNAAATSVNKEYSAIRRHMAREIHQKIKDGGMFSSWYLDTDFNKNTGGFNGKSCYFHFDYFGLDFEDYQQKSDVYEGILKTSYQNHYDNSNIEFFDKKYEELEMPIRKAERNLASAKQTLTDKKHDLSLLYSIGSCIGSTLWGCLKVAIHLVLSAVVFSIVGAITSAITDIDWLSILVGAIGGIICMVILWNHYDDDLDFMDWGLRKETIQAINSAKTTIATNTRLVEQGEKTRKSEAYKEAKARNEELRREDMELAQKWQRAWYNYDH